MLCIIYIQEMYSEQMISPLIPGPRVVTFIFTKGFLLKNSAWCFFSGCGQIKPNIRSWARILVQVTIYRRLLIGQDGHLDQSEAYDIS